MEKATEKQVNFIKELSERFQKPISNFHELTKETADIVIKTLLNGHLEDKNKSIEDVNPAQYGLALKMVHQKFVNNGMNPLDVKSEFLAEVRETYSLFEIK